MTQASESSTKKKAQTILSLKNVGVNYNTSIIPGRGKDFWALKDITLRLHQGESLGVIGRNGMGKSTLLRVMANIMRPDKGEYFLRSGCTASLLSLQVGFLPYLTGKENIILSGLLQGMSFSHIESLFTQIVEFSELGDTVYKPLWTYSDGMKARLGFAVSFHTHPDILLVDEVLGVGDAAFRSKSSDALRQIILSDRTVVLVSHNPDTVQELCERSIWIEQGRTMAEGPTELVLREYNHYVQKYVQSQ